MNDGESLVRLVQREDLDAVAMEAYDRVTASRGGEGNVFRAIANSIGALERVAALGEFVRWGTSLDERVREAVILIAAHETGCEYEWTHHARIARTLGMDPDAVVQGGVFEDDDSIAGDAKAVLELARSLARNDHRLDDEVLGTVRAWIGDQGIIDVAVTVGYYGLLAHVIMPLRVPLEQGVQTVPLPGGAARLPASPRRDA